MADPKTYTGSCHCGRVRYEVTADISQVISCDCSICSRTGALLAFAPASSFKLLSGEGDLSDYQFNTRTIHHLFCKNCGIRSFARGTRPDGQPTVAINVRCLEGVDLGSLQVMQVSNRG
ncbi:MAG: GFA family protein [Pseudomonadota bacterium]|nr:MAG: aldehyde-activating protein [Pseudomonadota bacterium]